MFEEKYIDLKREDNFIFDEVFVKNSYCVEEEEIKNKIVIDIGANVGMFSIFASEFKPKQIIAIEPESKNFGKLSKNIEKYKIKNIIIRNEAISNEIKTLYTVGTGGLAITTDKCENNSESVKVNTLSAIMTEYKDESFILKIDCEGAEYDILLSLKTEFIDKLDYIYAEIHTVKDHWPDEIIKFLDFNNFLLMKVNHFYVYGDKGQVSIGSNKIYKFKKIQKTKAKNVDITCVISSKNRQFSTLPLTLTAVCNQTYKPKCIIIFDDSLPPERWNEHKDLRTDPIYSHIFSLFDFYNISWKVIFGEAKGQVLNYHKSLEIAETEWIWRLDDDNVPENDVLEKLIRHVDYNVGAIAGLVINSTAIKYAPAITSNKIEDIFLGLNDQWFLQTDYLIKEVDHLYSSFIYRKSIAAYNLNLSPIGHREETMLTYEIKRKGYKLLIDPSAKTWHFCNPAGGNRSHDEAANMALKDEQVFMRKMFEWNVRPNDYSFVVLENGIGDHFCFKSILNDYFNKNKNKTHIFFTTYPEVFNDIKNIKQASIADAKSLLNNIDQYNVYKFMTDKAWKKTLAEAYKQMYNI